MTASQDYRSRFRKLATVFLAAIAVQLAGGSVPAFSQETPVISVGTQPYPGEASIFVAQDKGFFAKAGVRVDDRKMQSGLLTMNAMLAGSLDIATPVETGPMFAISNGSDLAVLAQISYNPEEVKPLVRVASGVKSAKDLVGKRLGYGAGSSNQFAMYNWLKAGGVSASQVTLVNLQPADLVTALLTGKIDVGFTWEPFLTSAVEKSHGKVVVVEGQHLYSSRLLLVSRPAWTGKNKDAISRFLRALTMAADWIRINRAEAVQITAAHISMDPKKLDPIFDRWQFGVGLSNDLVSAFDAQFQWASQAHLLRTGTKQPDFAKYFYPDSLAQVQPESVTYSQK